MAREFNIKFNDIQVEEWFDDLLKDTLVTKVTFTGENDLNSIKSMFENCTQLTMIEGEINLKDVEDIRDMLKGVELDQIILANVNNTRMLITIDSLNSVKNILIQGEIYDKEALKNLIDSMPWYRDGFSYGGVVEENIIDMEINIENEIVKIIVSDSLEQKIRNIDIRGHEDSIGESLPNRKYGIGLESIYKNIVTDEKEFQINDTIEGSELRVRGIQGETLINLSKEDRIVADEIEVDRIYELDDKGSIDLVSIEGQTRYYDYVTMTYSDKFTENCELRNSVDVNENGEYVITFTTCNAWKKLGKGGN